MRAAVGENTELFTYRYEMIVGRHYEDFKKCRMCIMHGVLSFVCRGVAFVKVCFHGHGISEERTGRRRHCSPSKQRSGGCFHCSPF